MRIAKTVGCLLLLCAIICGCIAMAKRESEQATAGKESEQGEGMAEAPPTELVGSVAVQKTYSKGLKFRSNGDGTCALAGIGSCTAACILIPPESPAGDRVVEILPYALKDCIVGAIEIPETVTTLSAASFFGCKRLAYLRVSEENPLYVERDGVLYNKEGSVLIYYPAGKTAGELTLDRSLKRIQAGAFAQCAGITTVTFGGTTSEWHSVIVGDENEALYGANFRFAAQN